MPKVYQVTARKDYPQSGIKKGDLYYYTVFWKRRKVRQKTPFTARQLIVNAHAQFMYDTNEQIQSLESLEEDEIDELFTSIEEYRDELESKYSNMENYSLEQTPSGEIVKERLDEVNELLDLIQEFKDNC